MNVFIHTLTYIPYSLTIVESLVLNYYLAFDFSNIKIFPLNARKKITKKALLFQDLS